MSLPLGIADRADSAASLDLARRSFLTHAGDGNLEAAVSVAVELGAGAVDGGDIAHELLRPVLVEVGRRWAHNEWGVAEERVATRAATASLTLIDSSLPRSDGHGHLLVACVEEEEHELPAPILAADLRRAGWRVSFLGESLPAAELRQFAARQHLDAVLLSCVSPLNLVPATRSVTSAHQLGIPVIVGGRAFGNDLVRAERIGADGFASNAAGVARLLDDPPRVRRPFDQPTVSNPPEWAVLEANRHGVAEKAIRRIEVSVPNMGALRTQLDRLTRIAAGAMLVDDARLFDDYVDWLIDFFYARGWGSGLVYELSRSLFAEVGEHSRRAAEMLGRTQDRLADQFDASRHVAAKTPPTVHLAEPLAIEPATEPARLAAVKSYEACVADPDIELEELVGMAATLCDTPVAWIGLMGEHTQRFPASHGLHFRSLPRDLAICALAIGRAEMVVIPDLAADDRFANHPFVLGDSRWRFYAAAPLTVGGLAVGTLAVVDYRPRLMRVEEQRHLTTLAREAIGGLELRRRSQCQSDPPAAALTRPEAEQLLEQVVDLRKQDHQSQVPALGTRDIARLLNVSTRTVINWATQGKLPSLQTAGGHYRFSSEAVIEFLVKSENGNKRVVPI